MFFFSISRKQKRWTRILVDHRSMIRLKLWTLIGPFRSKTVSKFFKRIQRRRTFSNELVKRKVDSIFFFVRQSLFFLASPKKQESDDESIEEQITTLRENNRVKIEQFSLCFSREVIRNRTNFSFHFQINRNNAKNFKRKTRIQHNKVEATFFFSVNETFLGLFRCDKTLSGTLQKYGRIVSTIERRTRSIATNERTK